MEAVRQDYAVPAGLEIGLVLGSTNVPRRWRWEKAVEGHRTPRR